MRQTLAKHVWRVRITTPKSALVTPPNGGWKVADPHLPAAVQLPFITRRVLPFDLGKRDILDFMDIQTKREILQAAKTGVMRHRWDTFVDDLPSIAQGGKCVVVSGCPACKKRFGTNTQYLDHLADDVMSVILRAAFKIAEIA